MVEIAQGTQTISDGGYVGVVLRVFDLLQSVGSVKGALQVDRVKQMGSRVDLHTIWWMDCGIPFRRWVMDCCPAGLYR